ncbi:MAG: V-type ATP synthase subunit E family protein [Betaproteobacteria bacterium]|jgi:V/A-type H+-transporting ATPase subunit E|nr:V-type ATP synthase subunit E family protein [Betaproteobacteria bacterium]
MNTTTRGETLKAALLARARALSDEFLGQARREADQLIDEANTRVRRLEERETVVAQAMAERFYRRTVQAAEIKMREEVERLRWMGVEAVMEALRDRLRALADDEHAYLPVFERLLGQAARAIEHEELVAEVVARDLARLQGSWESLARKAAPGKRIELSPQCRDPIGGVVVRDVDNTVRIDNSIEGRMERLTANLQRVIAERLYGDFQERH